MVKSWWGEVTAVCWNSAARGLMGAVFFCGVNIATKLYQLRPKQNIDTVTDRPKAASGKSAKQKTSCTPFPFSKRYALLALDKMPGLRSHEMFFFLRPPTSALLLGAQWLKTSVSCKSPAVAIGCPVRTTVACSSRTACPRVKGRVHASFRSS